MSSEIVGRERELSLLQAFFDHPVSGPRALVLEGEAGIGKSTLWLAAVAAASERSFGVLLSRPAETERTLPNLVLGDLLGEVPTEILASLPGPRRRAFEAAVLLREGSDAPVDPRALGLAVVALLRGLANDRPLVLAVDDDQWLDATSAATLDFALRRLPGRPVLLVLSRRLEGGDEGLETTVDAGKVERLRIGGLSIGATQVILRDRLEISFPRRTLMRLHEVSGGNPFYALELARALITTGNTIESTAELTVPMSLERLVIGRLGPLAASTRAALLLLAANGRLTTGLLRPLGIAPAAIEPAIEAHVIETAGDAITFAHPLLASATYQDATSSDRRRAHRRLATVEQDPVHRARHLALGADEPDADLANDLEAAAHVAGLRGMPIAAVELAGHALRLTPEGARDDHHRRVLATARAHSEAGDGVRARAMVDDVLARSEPGPRRAEALVLASELTDPRSAVAFLERALAEAGGDPALEAVIHASLAVDGRFTRGRAWAEPHAKASLELADRLGDAAMRANALSTLGLLRAQRGDPEALALAERADELARGLTDPGQASWAESVVGQVLTWTAPTEQARQRLEDWLADWGDRDERVREEIFWLLTLVEFLAGNWDVADRYADEYLALCADYGLEQSLDHMPLALIAVHRGQFAAARDHARSAIALEDGQPAAVFLAILAVCDLWSGNLTTAITGFARAEEGADEVGIDEPNLRWWRADYAEGLLQVGRIDDAERLILDWEMAAQRLGRERVVGQVLRSRGLIAAARGDLSTATSLLEEATGRSAAAGDPFGRARAFLALGTVLRRGRQKRTARAALEAALAGFTSLGALSWVATAQAELARIGGRTRIEGLSPSELAVATLVADGRTNREIASALFLGERTVASHLTRVYAKLGVRSRTELARRLAPPYNEASKVQTS